MKSPSRSAIKAAAFRQKFSDRVFDRFESHPSGTRHRGAGLGLSIVRALVELHGGRVVIDSVPAMGTTVTCFFPAAAAAIAAE